MSQRADPNLLLELKRYGEVNIESCFNCGNCSAICPLSTENDNFPRRVIRMAQLGLNERLLSSKELWLCYYCGECTQTCPREAEPGEFMATARRYAIGAYDPLGLAKLLYTSPLGSVVFLLVLAIVIGLLLVSGGGAMARDNLRLFEFIPAATIHNMGLAGIVIIALAGLAGLVNMVSHVRKAEGYATKPATRTNWLTALWQAIGIEGIGQKRYRQDCDDQEKKQAWYSQKWFVHASILWGFLGLLAATALDYLLEIIGVKPTGTWVPIWYPIRLLGTIAGLFLVYGSSLAIVRRWQKSDVSMTVSTPSDWIFLVMMWLAGVSGFLLEIAVYLPSAPIWGYWMMLFHVIVAMELVLLAPFTKFAHAIYRSAALYYYALEPLLEHDLASDAVGAD